MRLRLRAGGGQEVRSKKFQPEDRGRHQGGWDVRNGKKRVDAEKKERIRKKN